MKYTLSLLFCFFLLSNTAWSQRTCASVEVLEQELKADPSMKERMEEIERQTEEFYKKVERGQFERNVITIPVVFHVVHNTLNPAENVSLAQLQSQLDVLNEDFRFNNVDKTNIPADFAPLAADVQVQFCLATQTATGTATTGVNRKTTTKTSWGTSTDLKTATKGGLAAWDRTKYLNIWVCNIGGGILGYATSPGGTASLDGVVIDYRYIGRGGSAVVPFDKGRTATHEVGHWLNLRHIWGDATCGSDLVNDTPVHKTYNYGCNVHPKANTGCSPAGAEMFMNYMDYVDDGCMHMFTLGQKLRMQAVLQAGGARASLASSPGCLPPGTTACPKPATISASNITSTSAVITWAAVTGASSYSLEYKLSTATTWTLMNPTTTTQTLSNLTSGLTYNVRVRPICNGVYGAYSTTINVTAAGTISCGVPTGLAFSNVLSTSATVSWAAITGASSYSLQYKTNTATTYTTVSNTTTSLSLTGLTAATAYNVRVAAVCSGVTSAYSAVVNFTTAPANTTCTDNFEPNNTSVVGSSSPPKAITPGTAITAKISTTTDVDWFSFGSTSTFKNVKVTMTNLPADYDMILYRGSGQVGISENDGTLSESIVHNTTLGAATYFVQVYPFGGAFNNSLCYSLLATRSSTNLSRLDGSQDEESLSEEEIIFEQVKDEFQVFPNPVQSEMTLLLPFGKHQKGTVRMADITGREVYTSEFTGSSEVLTVTLDVSTMNPGIYLVQYANGNNVTTRKIVISDRK